MYGCAGIVLLLLQDSHQRQCGISVLFFPEFSRIFRVYLCFLYSGGIQNRLLFDYFADIFDTGRADTDTGQEVENFLDRGCDRGISGLFCTVFTVGI